METTNKINLGDVVKLVDSTEESELYIVTDLADFSYMDMNDVYKEEIEYEIMKIYPIDSKSDNSFKSFKHQNDLELVGKKYSSKVKLLLNFVLKERNKLGLFEEPPYLLALKGLNDNGVKKMPMSTFDTDVVRYDLLENVNDCLNAIEALTWLNDYFGDEAYLQLRELAENRTMKLIEELDCKDKDACLDAMNALKYLETMLGGEKYLKMRKKVLRKLKGL